jgi:small subunit ribosomal protein S13
MEQKLNPIVRMVSADLDGAKPIRQAFLKIKGISHSMINAICTQLKLDKNKKIGLLKEDEIKKIEESIKNPKKINIPSWMLNREKDHDTGEDMHLTGIDLRLRKEFDVKRLMKMKSYRGLRYSVGLPVRGQKTRSNFRKNKRKGRGSLGVRRKKVGKKG